LWRAIGKLCTGVNIGQYPGETIWVDRTRHEGLERIRISSIEPTTITNALLDRMASSSKLCPYLHIPLQSGDDTILSSMNRPYNTKEFIHLVRRAVAAIPHLGLGTDLMVGFPGETMKRSSTRCNARELLSPTPCSPFATAWHRCDAARPGYDGNARRNFAELSRHKRLALRNGISTTVSFLPSQE
jgi:threonylcarbamoyladenosine tRNA methylthiotransferase MtaB